MKSEISSFSEESAKRAAAADAPSQPIEPEIVDESSEKMNIDPAVMHGLMVVMVKGLVLRVDQLAGWKEHPNDQWCESTTQVVEILIEKYGGVGTSPEALLCFNLLVWMVPNLIVEKPKAKDAKSGGATDQTRASNEPINEPRKENDSIYPPDLSPFEDAVSA